IDLLINNAGTVESIFYGSGAYEGHDDPDLRNYDFDGWLDLLKTNLLGPARVCGAFVDNLSAGARPVAVNMASTLASIASTWQAGRYAYRTSKAALHMLTRSVGEWYEKRGIILVPSHRVGRAPKWADLRRQTRPKNRSKECAK